MRRSIGGGRRRGQICNHELAPGGLTALVWVPPVWHTSRPLSIGMAWGRCDMNMFPPTDILFPRWRCPTVMAAAPGRARLYNCNHIQLNFQFSPLLIRPVIREADAEHFLQRPVKRGPCQREMFWCLFLSAFGGCWFCDINANLPPVKGHILFKM